MRGILTVCLLVASQPLLIGAGVLTRWVIACGADACVSTVRAASPIGSPRDALLTALAAAAPYILTLLVAAVTWLLTGCRTAQPAAAPSPARSVHSLSPTSAPEGFADAEDAGGRLLARP